MPYELFQHRTHRIADCVVIDGDAIHAEVAEEYHPRKRHRIRLHGIDAPELAQPYGPESAQYLLNMMGNDPVYAYITQDSDAYDRAVAILHRGNRHDTFNARLIRTGLAYAYYGAPIIRPQNIRRAPPAPASGSKETAGSAPGTTAGAIVRNRPEAAVSASSALRCCWPAC